MHSKSNFINFGNLIQSLTATLQTLKIFVVCISQRMNIDQTNISFLEKNYDDLKIQSLVVSAWNQLRVDQLRVDSRLNNSFTYTWNRFYNKKITLPSLKLTVFEIITFHNILFQFLTCFQKKQKYKLL